MDPQNSPLPTETKTVTVTTTEKPEPEVRYVSAQPSSTPSDASRILIVLIILLLLAAAGIFYYTLTEKNGGSLFSGNKSYDPELESLRAQRASVTGYSNTGGLTAEALAGRISQDAVSIQELLNSYSSSLSAKDGMISQKQSEIDNLNRLNNNLSDQLLQLKKNLQDSALDSALKSKLESELADARRLLDASNKTIDQLNMRLAQSPDNAEYQRIIAELERLRAQIGAAPSQSEFLRLEEENRRLQQELIRLKSTNNRSRLFAENADLLSVNAQRLYRRLQTLEGRSNTERIEVYNNIRQELNARVVETVNFSSGSSTVGSEKASVLQKALNATNPRSEYLIVGYASHSGDAALNRELSSKRATAVATIADIQRGASQTVKAVFLGQTDRFSSTNDFANQICEVWEILPQQ